MIKRKRFWLNKLILKKRFDYVKINQKLKGFLIRLKRFLIFFSFENKFSIQKKKLRRKGWRKNSSVLLSNTNTAVFSRSVRPSVHHTYDIFPKKLSLHTHPCPLPTSVRLMSSCKWPCFHLCSNWSYAILKWWKFIWGIFFDSKIIFASSLNNCSQAKHSENKSAV